MGTVDISTSMIINRQCTICKETKLLGDFAKNKRMKLGVASWCLSCKKVKNASPAVRAARKAWRKRHADKVKRYTATRDGKRTLAWIMLNSAKGRAKKDGLPFALTEEDIIIPDICPLLKIPLFRGDGKPIANSPSLDRIIPHLGYVAGNVWVISYRANSIKNDATIVELETLTANLHTKLAEIGSLVR